jgi:hypothetical protein
MRGKRALQSLSYPIRLPDGAQADALRLLDVSRAVINATVAALWDRLDDFGERETKYAYKQVTAMLDAPAFHGDRLWRCQAEQAGRILRGQAERKKQFALILPLLEQGMILPKMEHTLAGKNRKAITTALAVLREENSDGGSAVALQSLIEQACNFYLQHGCFPGTYEEMQAVPVLKVGILPYAGDDGGARGQGYRFRIDLEGRCCYLAFRFPDEQGVWTKAWTEPQMRLPLPDPVVERLQAGESLAPTLREIAEPDGTRYTVLDLIIEVPVTPPPDLRREIARCWRKYEARNNDLAHLAANMLILLASVWGADLIAGESLKSLKSEGRGRGARGRWVHWRNNAQIRGALWRILRYKCHLAGLQLAWQHASGTTHTCPKCGMPANTYASPALDSKPLDAGAWLRCFACGWNGARDYAAAINIALLGVASLMQELEHQEQQKHHKRPTMTTKELNSESYTGSGLALRLPPTPSRGCLERGKLFVNGWIKSVTLHSALPPETMLRLCG